MKLLIINGPNLNLLGKREPEIYGSRSYAELRDFICETCAVYGADCDVFQSNHEGKIVDIIQDSPGKYDAIVINAAAYTHTSIAILDALLAVGLPAVEVHLSDPDSREDFRRNSFLRKACLAVFSGKGFQSYADAIAFIKERLDG